jgi:hypothetical protein
VAPDAPAAAVEKNDVTGALSDAAEVVVAAGAGVFGSVKVTRN